MSDPRLTPFNGRVAHRSLEGKVPGATRLVDGALRRIGRSVADLCREPSGARDRQMLLGHGFMRLDVVDGWAYGFSAHDGYCGWVDDAALVAADETLTHWVWTRESFARPKPVLKFDAHDFPLLLGAMVRVEEVRNDWSRIGPASYVPTAHLRHLDHADTDPVEVARRFLGTPYVWGGNSSRGIDCSGLMQAAFRACNLPCPGDSDMQEDMPGRRLSNGSELEPGDLVFWKGHVAMATGPNTIIHANAHHMAVVEEKYSTAVKRIEATDTGPVTSRLRPTF